MSIDADRKKVDVLDLDWSGPGPSSTDDLGAVEPIVLTRNSWNGRLSYVNCDCVLPRSFRVLGSRPLIHEQSSNSYTSRWRVGYQLARQRAWGPRHFPVPRGAEELVAVSFNRRSSRGCHSLPRLKPCLTKRD